METLKFSGINRDPRNEERGMCSEVINLRIKDGSWKPVGKKTVVAINGAMSIDRVFIHTIDPDTDQAGDQPGGKNYIGYDPNDGKIYQWELSAPTVRTEIGNIGSGKAGKVRFEALKNMVIVIDEVSRNTSYMFWKDGQYTFLSNRFPDSLRLIYYATPNPQQRDYTYYDDNSFLAAYGELLADMRDQGYEEGYVVVRYGYELFDGNVVMHSAPMLVPMGGPNYTDARRVQVAIVSSSTHRVIMWPGKLYCSFLNFTTNSDILSQLNDEYKHIVKRINFYVTKPTPSNDVNAMGKMDGGSLNYGLADGTPFINAMDDELYYKVHSIAIGDIALGTSQEIPVGSMHPYESLPTMPGDALTHHTIAGSASMVYNSRILLGDIASRLSPGYNPANFFSGVLGSPVVANYTIEAFTTVLMEEGEKVVQASSDFLFTSDDIMLPTAISYPDTRASKMEIYKRVSSSGLYYKMAEYLLEKHPTQNFAYKLIEADLGDGGQTLTSSDYAIASTPPAVDDMYSDYNMVKMSALNNPLHFPVENSYPVGLSQVIAFSTMAMPISQGQYGQYPIIVFTTSGMWSMELGTGRVAISSVVPLNDLICNNPKAITKAGKAIIFPTNEGLIMLQGGDDVLISQPLRGEPASQIITNSELQLFISHQDGLTDLVNLSPAISSDPFSTYLFGAAVGYDSENREIIVSNRSYNYSYVFSLINNTWTKITERFKYFVSDWPSTYAVDTTNSIVNISSEGTAQIDTLIITRPIYYSDLIKVDRLGVKASINATSTKVTGVYMFGSVDGRSWSLVTGIQKAGSFNNPYVNHALMSFREIILVVAGNYRASTYIREINLDLRGRYGNKKIR